MELGNVSALVVSNRSGDYLTNQSSEAVPTLSLLFCAFLTVATFSLNFRVICIVFTMPTDKRSANILVAHLSFVNILLNYFIVILLLSRCKIWPLENAYGLCVGHAYFRNAIVAMIPVNVTAIAYEKIKVLQPNFRGEKILLSRTVVLMWSTVLVGSLPNLLTTSYTSPLHPSSVGHCKLHPILDSVSLTVGFELMRLLLYHVLPSTYIHYALLLIRAKVSKYLFPPSNKITSNRFMKKVRKIRFILLNGLAFILIWLPTMVLLFHYKIYIRSGESSMSPEIKHGSYFFAMVILGYIYIMVNPLIQLHLGEHLGDIKWYSMTFPRISPAIDPDTGENTAICEARQVELINDVVSVCNSRESTFQHS